MVFPYSFAKSSYILITSQIKKGDNEGVFYEYLTIQIGLTKKFESGKTKEGFRARKPSFVILILYSRRNACLIS